MTEYLYNNKPLQKSYNNSYSLAEKIEINKYIQSDFENGMLSFEQMYLIINDGLFGSYTCQTIIDDLLFKGKLKKNPITLTTRSFKPKKKPFDL